VTVDSISVRLCTRVWLASRLAAPSMYVSMSEHMGPNTTLNENKQRYV
jgi:hypothetical protein